MSEPIKAADGVTATGISPPQQLNSGKGKWIALGSAAAFAVLFYLFCGLYTVQPIGAVPDGKTAIVWRENDEPFFNSADATCLRRVGYVSLMCRAMAMGTGPADRIIVRLPYQSWAYSLSTGGETFDR